MLPLNRLPRTELKYVSLSKVVMRHVSVKVNVCGSVTLDPVLTWTGTPIATDAVEGLTVVVSDVDETKVVGSSPPLNRITDDSRKPVPVAVSVRSALPRTASVGLIDSSTAFSSIQVRALVTLRCIEQVMPSGSVTCTLPSTLTRMYEASDWQVVAA